MGELNKLEELDSASTELTRLSNDAHTIVHGLQDLDHDSSTTYLMAALMIESEYSRKTAASEEWENEAPSGISLHGSDNVAKSFTSLEDLKEFVENMHDPHEGIQATVLAPADSLANTITKAMRDQQPHTVPSKHLIDRITSYVEAWMISKS